MVSLRSLFDGTVGEDSCHSSLTIEGLAFAMIHGGWPASIGQKEPVALRQVYNYYPLSGAAELFADEARAEANSTSAMLIPRRVAIAASEKPERSRERICSPIDGAPA